MDARIYEDAAVGCVARRRLEAVYSASFDVYRCYLRFVMRCQYRELDGASPGRRLEDSLDILFSWMPKEKHVRAYRMSNWPIG